MRSVSIVCLLLTSLISAVATSSAEFDDRNLSIAGITLGKDSIDELKQKLGDGAVFKVSKEQEAASLVCYVSENRNDNTTLLFVSGAAGGWSTVTEFQLTSGAQIVADSHTVDRKRCAVSKMVSAQVRTSGGLGIGTPKAAVELHLGRPNTASANTYTYKRSTEKQVRINGRTEEVTSEKTMIIRFAKNKVVDIRVVFTETT